MKTVIQENEAYKLFAEIRPCINPDNLVELRFMSKYEGAKNPEELQTKFTLVLTPEERQRLKDFL